MKTDAIACKVETNQWPPSGTYPGLWGGYHVDMVALGVTYTIKTKTGVRGVGIECTVDVRNGSAVISTNE